MFLLKVPKRSIRQQKIKNLLLMALRLLILALLVGAFARPYLTQPAKPSPNGTANRAIVMMLDNSYSMRYGNNFERLKAEAQRRIDSMRASDRMSIIAFNENATLLSRPTSDKNALKAVVDTLEPSYRRPLLARSEEHTSELQSLRHLVCRLLLEKKNKNKNITCIT